MSSQAPFGVDATANPPVSQPLEGADRSHSAMEVSTAARQRASTNPFVGLAQESTGSPQPRARAATALTGSNTNVEPGRFDTHVARERRAAANAGLDIALAEQDPFAISPTPLRNALESHAHLGQRFINVGGLRVSYASDVSSISPSEADMMTGGAMVFPRSGRSFERPHPGLAGRSMDDVYLTPEELSASGYPHSREFSTVESIFDVIPLNMAGANIPVQASDSSIPAAFARPRVPIASENESPYGYQGSRTTSTPTRPSRALSTPYTSIGVPIQSLVAGAATGEDVISGNRTLEQSSFGSEEIAARKQHYEGCMLCEPLPSPRSSVSSIAPIQFELSKNHPGPPPDIPLPSLRQQTTMVWKGPVSTPTAMDGLGAYMELQGEVGTFIPGPAPTTPPPVLEEPGTEHYFGLDHPASLGTPYAAGYPHRASLSTLQEGDEESNPQRSSKGVRLQSTDRPRTGNTTASTVLQSVGPVTTGNESESSLIRTSNAPERPQVAYNSRLQANIPRDTANPLRRWADRISRLGTQRDDDQGIELQERPPLTSQYLEPHPGVRVDRPAVDGSFEFVDLSALPAPRPPNAEQRSPPEPVGMLNTLRSYKRKTCKWFSQVVTKVRGPMYRNRWTILGGLFIAMVLLIVVPVWFVAFPRMAQKQLDKADFNVTSVSITGAKTDSLNLRLGVRMMDSMIDASFEPEQSFVLRYEDPSIDKRDHSKGHTEVDGKFPNILGFLQLADQDTYGKKLANGVVLEGNEEGHRFRLSDAEGFADIMSRIVFEKEGVPAVLVGKCKIKAAGLKTEAEFSKEIALPVVGGIDTHVAGYEVLNNFAAHLQLTTNSSVEIDFGTVTFDLVYGLTTIGTTIIDVFRIQKGTTTITATGYLSEEMSKNPAMLGRFLTSLYIQTNSNPTTALSLQGRNATINGTEISWFTGAVRKLNIPLPAVDANEQGDIVTGLELGFGMVVNEKKILAQDGYVSAKFNFSFASGGSAAELQRAGHRLELGTMSGDSFARIRVPIGPVSARGGKSTSNFTNTEVEVLNATFLTQGFLRPIIHDQTVNISIQDNITAEVESGLGTARFEDIAMPETVWEISGYRGFNSKVVLNSPQINQSPSGIKLDVKLELTGMGDVRLKFGQVQLRAFYDGLGDGPMGALTIPNFSVSPGSLSLPATMTFGATKDEHVPFNGFMAAFFAGGAIPLRFDAPNASTNAVISNSFRDVNFPATLNSGGYSKFIQRAEIVIDQSDNEIKADLEFMNLLPIPLKIGTFLFNITDAATGTIIGTGASFSETGAGRELDQGEAQTYRLTLSNVINENALKGLFKGERPCDIEGDIVIGFGNVDAKIRVKVRRVVGLTVVE